MKASLLVARELAERAALVEPGDTLPPEHQLIEELGVGRSTMREALRILELLGVVAVKAGRRGGPVVLQAEPETLAHTLSMALQFTGVSFAEVLRARAVIEAAIAREAAILRTSAELAAMDEILIVAEEAVDDQRLWHLQNAAFHRTIAVASRNAVLSVFEASLKAINDGHVSGLQYTAERLSYINYLHRKVYEGIEKRDPEFAGEAMTRHLEDFVYWLQRQSPALLKQPVKWELPFR